MTKRAKWAWVIMIGPWILLPAVIAGFAILTFVLAALGTSFNESGAGTIIFDILRGVFGLLGIVAVLGMIVGIPLGVIMLGTEKKAGTPEAPKSPNS